MNGSILDWEGWRALETILLLLAIPAILWLWAKLDGIKSQSGNAVTSLATDSANARQAMRGEIVAMVQGMKNEADKVHSDLWKAIHELGQEQLRQLEKQHAHELWARDHFIGKDTLSASIDGLKQVMETRMDALSEQIDAQTAAVNHLMAAQARKSR